jgi:ubiquinone/menaquinone biosynthesis C-methylase UbiE
MPYSDSAFDMVTCRKAAHHFGSAEKFVREVHRVRRVNGRLGIVDMSPQGDTVILKQDRANT